MMLSLRRTLVHPVLYAILFFFKSTRPIAAVGINNKRSAICAIHSILGILLAGNAIAPINNKIAIHAATAFVRNKVMPKTSKLNGNKGPVANNKS